MPTEVADKTDALHLIRLEAQNFMRLDAIHIDADGKHVKISGPNGSGKTTTIDSIWAGLGGKPTRDMPEPVKRGAAKASVKLDLGEYQVERVWTEKGTRLVVTAADGSKVSKPQQLLDGLLGKYALDPVAFLERRPQDQVDDVLGIAGVEPPVEKVQEITGEEDAPRPGESADKYLERLSADDSGLWYLRRRDAGRQADQKRAALDEQRAALQALGGPVRPEEQPRPAKQILREIEALESQAATRRGCIHDAESVARDLAEDGAKLDGLRKTLTAREAELIQIQRQLDAKAQEVARLKARIAEAEPIVAELLIERDRAQAAADVLPDPAPKIAELQRQLGAIGDANKMLAKRQVAAEQLDRLAAEHERATVEHQRLDQVLAALRDLRVHLLDGVDLGVPGLAVGNGELRLKGVSFRQASQAEQIRVACAVAMRQQPRLRLLRIDDGEHLDAKSRAMVLRLAEDHQWQVIMTMVADLDELKVEIVEAGE